MQCKGERGPCNLQLFPAVVNMPSARPFACTCAPVFRGDLAEVAHANDKIELSLWSASVANQSSQGPEIGGGPQLGESALDEGTAAL